MKLYSVSVTMDLVIAASGTYELTDSEIANMLRAEIRSNGFLAGKKKVREIKRKSQIPSGWGYALPWTVGKVNRQECTVNEIMRKR